MKTTQILHQLRELSQKLYEADTNFRTVITSDADYIYMRILYKGELINWIAFDFDKTKDLRRMKLLKARVKELIKEYAL